MHRPSAFGRSRLAVLAALALGFAGVAMAQAAAQEPAPAAQTASASEPKPADFWSLKLGTNARELDPAAFIEYACGTNGGPPARLIAGWTAFADCPKEPGTGLHEVEFRYDDELEYWARAYNQTTMIEANAGTKLYIIPVITSALFDDDGFLVGIRAVTDPRVSTEERMRAVALRNFLMGRFDPDGWTCELLPKVEGETPIANRYLKERCTKLIDDGREQVMLEAHHYRKAGQYGIDPRTNEAVQGLFRSDTRFEQTLVQPIADRAERLAALQTADTPQTEMEQRRQKALDCPGCDLSGIDLKRQDLTGANLAGANLSGANLHGAILIKADLSGANLSGANLNRANLRQANLTGVNATKALFYGAVLDAANLSSADLSHSRMQEAEMTRVNLEGARVVAVDMSRVRLSSASMKGANLGGTWLQEALLRRADLSDVTMIQALLAKANFSDANLTNANLVGSDLIGADLRGATLTGADFSGTRLTQALLPVEQRQGAKFENAIGLQR